MGEAKLPFGMSAKVVKALDWSLANKRVLKDQRSDFIYAPHLRSINLSAGSELIERVEKALSSGTFMPGLPVHMEVPKSSRVATSKLSKMGPAHSRQGSILLPRDRLLYQAIADASAEAISDDTDFDRSFSHRIVPGAGAMFEVTRIAWGKFQARLKRLSKKKHNKYVLKLDIANCFSSINQHMLINKLGDLDIDASIIKRLEQMLIKFTGSKSSRGIVQGIYPSDLFGNYYMNPIDEFIDGLKLDSARYVDDIYIFVESADHADAAYRKLIRFLRRYDLTVNEAKARLMPSSFLLAEEPDLEELFSNAVEEVTDQADEFGEEAGYGFQGDWEDEEESYSEQYDIELAATELLFDSADDYEGQEENIERFCLPLFARAKSDYAVDHVIANLMNRPSMAQIYCSYLSKFSGHAEVRKAFLDLATEKNVYDWQRMWAIAGLLVSGSAKNKEVSSIFSVFESKEVEEPVRAVAAIFTGRYGNHSKRTDLFSSYGSEGSEYLRAAIYFSSRWFPTVEKSNAKSQWANDNELNELITVANAAL